MVGAHGNGGDEGKRDLCARRTGGLWQGDRRAEWILESPTPVKKVKKEEEVEERAGIGEEKAKKEEKE